MVLRVLKSAKVREFSCDRNKVNELFSYCMAGYI